MDDPTRPRFHLAMPVDDLDAAREFYGNVGLDYEEFEDLVHSIAKTADLWDDKFAQP